MTGFKVGDRVKYTGTAYLSSPGAGIGVVLEVKPYGCKVQWRDSSTSTEEFSELALDVDSVNPNHYQFPNGAEVRFISEWLTANAAQALQYIARSSRIDGVNKGEAKEDIQKAIRFLEFELERLDR